ncbi:hypothetical protein PAECIP112173_02304 [Paenibacillus sp. JJ-100]|uniref:hypothetical protein n=1 Tax=Paenibacillus sp. JJ-100 TaxID=2974896 RepID=UPI0022FF95AC|nr:hypothetical protein [Paenibacillus sp. JJ-100]CAI6073884.1 hypothetical protein PAECIP112173_02304 [Paenibacillus sp. JJ-100]
MEWRYQYESDAERDELIKEYKSMHLIREENISEGNFLIFAEEPLREPAIYVSVPQEEFESLKQESTLLKAQSSALSERADFVEDVIAEMATQLYK